MYSYVDNTCYDVEGKDWYGIPRARCEVMLAGDDLSTTFVGTFKHHDCKIVALDSDNKPNGMMMCYQCATIPQHPDFRSAVLKKTTPALSKSRNDYLSPQQARIKVLCISCTMYHAPTRQAPISRSDRSTGWTDQEAQTTQTQLREVIRTCRISTGEDKTIHKCVKNYIKQIDWSNWYLEN